MYKGCDFGCKYCYANARKGNYSNKFDIANFDKISKMFKDVFEKEREYKNIEAQMIRHGVPLHLGGMSDPFQSRESRYKLAYKLVKLTNKYDYPMQISTKVSKLPKEYWAILNPEIHAFQISLMSLNREFVRKYEKDTPLPNNRVNFIRELKEKGFWVGLRLQPLICIEEALELVSEIGTLVDYITVEHLKIPSDAPVIRKLFKFEKNKEKFYYPRLGKNYELKKEIKKKNIEKLKRLVSTPIGVGDNDLHYMSESRNCCGLDTINSNFSNYMKYNSTYFRTSEKEVDKSKIWYPTASCSKCFSSDTRKSYCKTVKDYTDDYIKNYLEGGD